MKLLDTRTTWIHTHFLTDCVKLSATRARRVESEMERFLRELGIQYGIHFEERRGERHLRIVLECIPLPSKLDRIRSHLTELVRDIPVRPEPVRIRIQEGISSKQEGVGRDR